MTPLWSARPVGIVLAGGLARRLGGLDKGSLRLGGATILERIIACLGPQTATLALNANGDLARFAGLGLPVIPDVIAGYDGPLIGILSGMEWVAREWPAATHIVTVPADTPFLPMNLAAELRAAGAAAGPSAAGAAAGFAVAASRGRVHPVCGLWPVHLAPALRRAIADEGMRRVGAFADRHGAAIVEFTSSLVDPFFNVNTAADLAEAERLVIEINDCRSIPA